MSIERLCKDCGRTVQQYMTTQNRCTDCMRKRYTNFRKKRIAINKQGKQAEKWKEFRTEWITNHTTPSGEWTCALQISPHCLRTLTIDTLTLDHKLSRSGNPKLRYVDSNIQPSCIFCNGQKGSRKI